MDRSIQIDTFSRISRVSRETINSLIRYEQILIKSNKTTNLIGNSTINQIWTRHFLDSYQVIDFIGENTENLIDIGSGAGLPGIVLAIAAKEKRMSFKTYLIDKSPKKSKFLNSAISELNLNAEVINKNIFNYKMKPKNPVFIARAFKPLNLLLELMHKISDNWKKIIIFMGKTGDRELLQASKIWNIEYKQRVSVTSSDSIILEINKLKKK